MQKADYKLYDETIVKNIMKTTGMLIYDVFKDNESLEEEDIISIIEISCNNVIEQTLNEMCSE
jgi:hypothetical protein